MSEINLGIAFVSGVLSFLSPCVLPLIPGYISFLSGVSLEELKAEPSNKNKFLIKVALTSLFFVLGFSVVFISFGASATLIGRLFHEYTSILTRIAGVIIFILGLYLTGILRIKWLSYRKGINVDKFSTGPAGAFLVGFAFGFGWTPCVGPILAGILALAATEENIVKGMILLCFYSLGLGIPFILTGFFVGFFMKFFERFKYFLRWIEIIAGIFLIFVGILVFFNKLHVLMKFVPPVFYNFSK